MTAMDFPIIDNFEYHIYFKAYAYTTATLTFDLFSIRFTCTAQNGFGVDMVSTFLYPLAPAFY